MNTFKKKVAPALFALSAAFLTQAAQAKFVYVYFNYVDRIGSALAGSIYIKIVKNNGGSKCFNYTDRGGNLRTFREFKTHFTVPDDSTNFIVRLYPAANCVNTTGKVLPQFTSNVAKPPADAYNGKKYTYVWIRGAAL